MLKRAFAALAALVSLAACAFFSMIIVLLVRSEVLPALSAGSFNIQTDARILNRVWEGNELYWLLAAYMAIAVGMGIVATLSARVAFRRDRSGTQG